MSGIAARASMPPYVHTAFGVVVVGWAGAAASSMSILLLQHTAFTNFAVRTLVRRAV